MLNFVLCDDNLSILDRLDKMLQSLFVKHDLEASVVFKSDRADEILTYVTKNKVDVLILDIQLQSSMTGIDLATKVREINKNTYFIFTTGHLEYALLAYQVKTFDYLAKPVTSERLESTLLRLLDDVSTNSKRYLKLNNKDIIRQDDIEFIKKDGMKLVIHTASTEYESYTSFTKIQDCLPENFVRCHKSYIANLNNVKNIQASNNTILFENSECYIGPKYKNNFMEVLNNYGNITNNLDYLNNTK